MTSQKLQAALLGLALALGGAGLWLELSRASRGSTCAAAARPMGRLELVFGLSRQGRADITEAEWRQFLDHEVTPRFPDGLTVLAGNGRWRNSEGAAVSEPARVLLIWTHPAGDLDIRIEAVRKAWKDTHAQDSVLRAESPSCVSF